MPDPVAEVVGYFVSSISAIFQLAQGFDGFGLGGFESLKAGAVLSTIDGSESSARTFESFEVLAIALHVSFELPEPKRSSQTQIASSNKSRR